MRQCQAVAPANPAGDVSKAIQPFLIMSLWVLLEEIEAATLDVAPRSTIWYRFTLHHVHPGRTPTKIDNKHVNFW